MTKQVYCIAVLGRSPALLTELMWWLVERNELRVCGVEVWTTVSFHDVPTGFSQLGHAIRERRIWDTLRASLGERWDWIPEAPDLREPEDGTSPPPPAIDAFTVIGFKRDRHWIDDVRTPEDARAMTSQLHDRIRTLRKTLPEEVGLVGSLAGGRKTMSAAMQGAFQLQARVRDRLVHVLTHPRIEDRASGVLDDFVVPTETVAKKLGISVEEQVLVYDVPFFPMRDVLLDSERAAHVVRDLDDRSFQSVLEVRRILLSSEQISATVEQEEGTRVRWRYIFRSGGKAVDELSLSPAEAETLAALVLAGPEGADARGVYETMVRGRGSARNSAGLDELEPWDETPEVAATFIRRRISRLRARLQHLESQGLGDFALTTGERPARYSVRSAHHITIPSHLLSSQ